MVCAETASGKQRKKVTKVQISTRARELTKQERKTEENTREQGQGTKKRGLEGKRRT